MNRELSLRDVERIFCDRTPGEIGKYRHFSVMLPLIEMEGGLHVLYEVRSKNLVRQPGEICFPGGFCEKGETYLEAAVRECCEELSLESEKIRIICELDKVMNYSGFTIHCYLGELKVDEISSIIPEEAEVEEVFAVPVSWLLENEPHTEIVEISPVISPDFPYEMLGLGKDYYWRKGKMEVPFYKYQDKIIWGITGRITKQFVEILKKFSNF